MYTLRTGLHDAVSKTMINNRFISFRSFVDHRRISVATYSQTGYCWPAAYLLPDLRSAQTEAESLQVASLPPLLFAAFQKILAPCRHSDCYLAQAACPVRKVSTLPAPAPLSKGL